MKKKASLEARLKRKYTITQHLFGREYHTRLIVAGQMFTVTPVPVSKYEAEWFRTMLAKALAQIVEENK